MEASGLRIGTPALATRGLQARRLRRGRPHPRDALTPERGLSERPTPLLGGLAIFAGALVAGLIWLPAGYYKEHQLWHGVLLAAAVITSWALSTTASSCTPRPSWPARCSRP
jgi:UDP-N-acetylmuramyl pentapeptide phosphotransferase/UDP-N-acetylglucosamine-1-phosphate transferase